MKKRQPVLLGFLLAALLGLAACQWQQEAPAAVQPPEIEAEEPAAQPAADGQLLITPVESSHAFADAENHIYGQVTLHGLAFSGNPAAEAIAADLRQAEDVYLAELADEEGALFAADSSVSFDHEITYTLAYQDEALISVTRDCIISGAKAAHAQSQRFAYNYDAVSGQRLAIADLLGPGWRETAVSAIYQQINEAEELGNYYPDLERLLVSEFREDQWQADGDNVQIIYNPYQIAPYSAGILVFSLPRQDAVV